MISRLDPTRSITLRKSFQAALGRRFLLLRKLITELVLKDDAFGMKPVHNHKFASTQVNLDNKDIIAAIKQVQKQLDPEDIVELEDKPHVTIRYGLHEEDPIPVTSLIMGTGPISIKLGRLSLFRSAKQDVLKIDVSSNGLDHLNRIVSLVPNTQTYREYNPHLTVAYLKPGTGEKYVGIRTGLEGLDLIVTKAVFSDKERNHTQIALNTRWAYQTNLQKLAAFRMWLQDQMKSIITSEDEWWNDYVQQGYEKGAKRALDDVMQTMPDLDKPKEGFGVTERQFMTSSFGRVVPVEKVKLLASRVLSDLDGITDFMETRIIRALTDGLVQGQHPKEIASEMAKSVDVGLSRARTLAQTEIIRAHAEGQLDGLQRLGVQEVGVNVEWSTAGDNKVCKLCRPLEGVVLTIDEARGMLPRHPRCRCSFKPAGMIDRAGNQIKSKNAIEAAITKSLEAEAPKTKRSMAKSGKLSSWVGAKLKVTSKKSLIS